MGVKIACALLWAVLVSSSISVTAESQVSQLVNDYNYCVMGEITEINVHESGLYSINFSISKIFFLNLSRHVIVLYNETALYNRYNITLETNATYIIFIRYKKENLLLPSDEEICPVLTPSEELIDEIQLWYSKKVDNRPNLEPRIDIEPEFEYIKYLSLALITMIIFLSLFYIRKKHV